MTRRHGAKCIREQTLRAADSSFVQGDDGFWIFWPTENKGGLNSRHLRIIANELERRNAPVQAELDRYFGK